MSGVEPVVSFVVCDQSRSASVAATIIPAAHQPIIAMRTMCVRVNKLFVCVVKIIYNVSGIISYIIYQTYRGSR